MNTALRMLLVASIACLLGGGVAGCAKKENPAFHFDRLDHLPDEEKLTEFSLGQYRIPIPVTEVRGGKLRSRRNRLQFDFQLFAVVSPDEKAKIESAWGLHQGKIRNQVINVCRHASVEELQDPELATLKARLSDVLALQLGEKRLRQLLITDIVSQQL
jgi:hypothetical protein